MKEVALRVLVVLYPVNCLATLQNSQGLWWVIPHKSLKFRTCPSVTVFQKNLGGRSAEFAEGWLSTRVNYTSFQGNMFIRNM